MEPIPLKHPVKREGGGEITEISIRRAHVRDRHAAAMEEPDNAVLREDALLRMLTPLSPKEFGEIDLEDLGAIQSAFANLVGRRTDPPKKPQPSAD